MLRMAFLVIGISSLLCCGCQKTLPATVNGTITIDDKPLPEGKNITGEVMLYPVGGGAAAYGTIGAGGQYVVQTGGTQGLEPGEYKVTVRVVEVAPEPPGGYQNAPGQKVISPPRYQDREKSELIVDVKAGPNRIDLNLTSTPR